MEKIDPNFVCIFIIFNETFMRKTFTEVNNIIDFKLIFHF